MAAGKVPTANLTALYNNTTPGSVADPAAVDNAVQDIVQTLNDNFDKHVGDISTHASSATLAHPDKSVIRAKLADKVVGAGQIDDAAVGQSHHQDNGIPGRAIGDNVILQRHMSDNSVGPAELQASAVQRTHLGTGVVGSGQLDPTLLQNYGDIAIQAKFTDMTNSKIENEKAPLGAELIDSTGWTSGGWTGDFAAGFTHTVGNTSPLRRAMGATGSKFYQIFFTTSAPLESSSTELTVSIGNSVGFELYRGSITEYTVGIQSISDGDLVFTPISGFNKTISNISVKEITGEFTAPFVYRDSNGVKTLEIRPTKAELGNTFIGIEAGKRSTTGDFNVGLGYQAMSNNTSGFWDVAIGNQAMKGNTTGSRNVALGNYALNSNISGHRNIGIGSHALLRNTHGANNVGIGADSLFYNTTGNYNIAMGLSSLSENTTGNYNVALGSSSLASNTIGSFNVGLGYGTLTYKVTGDYNVALGIQALGRGTAGGYNIAIGREAGYQITANSNIAIGYQSLTTGTAINDNVAIGEKALSLCTSDNNIAIGREASYNQGAASYNIALGKYSLYQNTTGAENVAIGYSAGKGTASSVVVKNVLIGSGVASALATGGDFNVVIGASSGVNLTTGNRNIIIGYNAQANAATSTNTLNIGNTIYGNIGSTQQQIGIGVQFPTSHIHLKAGIAAQYGSSLKIEPGILLTTPEVGAIEFDGTNLYFTNNSGVRKTLAVV